MHGNQFGRIKEGNKKNKKEENKKMKKKVCRVPDHGTRQSTRLCHVPQIWHTGKWTSNFVNNLGWRNFQNKSCRFRKVIKLCSWQLFYLNSFRISNKQFTLGLVYYVGKENEVDTSESVCSGRGGYTWEGGRGFESCRRVAREKWCDLCKMIERSLGSGVFPELKYFFCCF